MHACAQSYLTLCNPLDWSPPRSSVHGIFQARILGWVAISFSIRCSMDFQLITVINIPHQALLIESGDTINSEQHPHSYAVSVSGKSAML